MDDKTMHDILEAMHEANLDEANKKLGTDPVRITWLPGTPEEDQFEGEGAILIGFTEKGIDVWQRGAFNAIRVAHALLNVAKKHFSNPVTKHVFKSVMQDWLR